ncbi:MAG: glycosyltransferase [Candidatus Aminicenantes bacterium]|nr:glycosyltransferase [Candidatus Aminicenantes bacterium]
MKTLTVIIPVYNEQDTILKIVEKVKKVDIDKQIIIVNDASTDQTPQLLDRYNSDREIEICHHVENMGRGAALKTGLSQASGYISVFQDADLELDPSNISKLIQPILDGEAEVVFGSRFLGKGFIQGMGFGAYMANVILIELTDRMFKANLTDVLTMYQVTKTEIFRKLAIETNRWGSTIEITAKFLKKGYKILDIPVEYIPRRKDTGKKVKWSDFYSCLKALLKYRYFFKE